MGLGQGKGAYSLAIEFQMLNAPCLGDDSMNCGDDLWQVMEPNGVD